MYYESKDQREQREKEDAKIIGLIFKPLLWILINSFTLTVRFYKYTFKLLLYATQWAYMKILKFLDKKANKNDVVIPLKVKTSENSNISINNQTTRDLLQKAKSMDLINPEAELAFDDMNLIVHVADINGYNGLIGIVLLFISNKNHISVSEIQRAFMIDLETATKLKDDLCKLNLIIYSGDKLYKVQKFNPEAEFKNLIKSAN